MLSEERMDVKLLYSRSHRSLTSRYTPVQEVMEKETGIDHHLFYQK